MALNDNKMKFKLVKIKKTAGIDTNELERVKFKVKKTNKKDFFLKISPKSSFDDSLDIEIKQQDIEPNKDSRMEGSVTIIVEPKQEFETPHKNEWIFETESTLNKVILVDAIKKEQKDVPSINKMFYLNKVKNEQDEIIQKEVISTEDSSEVTLEEYLSENDNDTIPVVTAEEPMVSDQEQDLGVFAIMPLSLEEMKIDDYASETFALNPNNLVKEEEILEQLEQEEAPLVVQDENIEPIKDETSAFGEQTTEDALNEAEIESDNLDEEIEKIQQELNEDKRQNDVKDKGEDYLAAAIAATIASEAKNQKNTSENEDLELTAEELLFDTFVENEIKRQNQAVEEDSFYEEIINSLLD